MSERLKETHRGHTIELSRENCLGGWEMLYYSIFRDSDGYECVSNFTTDESPLDVFMGYMKERIDDELAQDDPWEEQAELRAFGWV